MMLPSNHAARARLFRARAAAARELAARILGTEEPPSGPAAPSDLARIIRTEFSEAFNPTSDLISRERIHALNACFQRIAQSFASFSALLAEIQNEYILVINALINILDEKAFLRAKINKLMIEYASKRALDTERQRIIDLVAKWEVSKANLKRTQSLASDEEIKFITTIGKIYDTELAKKQPEKRKKDLAYLGRWRFVKDWIEERSESSEVLADLLLTIKENNSYYRSLFPEDDNIMIHEYDSPEVRKVKHHIEEQRRITRTFMRDHVIANEKIHHLRGVITDVDDRIHDVTELLDSRFGHMRRKQETENNGSGESETNSVVSESDDIAELKSKSYDQENEFSRNRLGYMKPLRT